MAPMSSENSRIQPLWPTKDRLLSSDDLTGTHNSNNQIGTIIRSFSIFGEMCVAKLCARIPTPLATVTMLMGALIFFYPNTTLAGPAYVQGNYMVPQSPQDSVTVPYTAAQGAGDLNVVIVGWNNTTTQISSVTDTTGNVYQLVIGPTQVNGSLSQSIFYAKNIAQASADGNAVTVTFSGAAAYPDIRVLEYRGVDPLNPVDVLVGATGNSTMASSGAVTTTNAMDLLVAANTVRPVTTSSGSGFASRLLTEPDGDIAEDEIVTTTGSYSASATLGSAGQWVMQMVAFRAAASPTPTPTPTPPPLAYIQGNYAVPQNPETSVTVPFTKAQGAGDLNVVVVGWNDSTAQVSSVTDTMLDVYQLAVGPTQVSGYLSQSIFYAKGIAGAAAGANAVTVTFSSPANAADVRVLEYSGIDTGTPVDVFGAATGNSATSSSGAVTTTNATDLILGANCVWTSTTGPGSGFAQRLLTKPDGDIAEDALATIAGSISATAPLSSAGPWVMQMVAFRVAGSPTPAPTPSNSVTLAWNPEAATGNSATNAAGYYLYIGTTNGTYTQVTDVKNATTYVVPNLTSGTTYYFAVTAYNSTGTQSPYSNQVSYAVP